MCSRVMAIYHLQHASVGKYLGTVLTEYKQEEKSVSYALLQVTLMHSYITGLIWSFVVLLER